MQDNTQDNLESPAPKKRSGLKTRAITSVFIAAVYVVVLLFTLPSVGPELQGRQVLRFVYDIFVVLIALAAGLEMCRAFANKYAKPLWVFVVLNVVVGFSVFYIAHFVISERFFDGGQRYGIIAYFFALVAMFLSCLVFTMFSKKYSMNNVLTTMLVLIYPTALFVYMLSLNYLSSPALSNSAILLMFLLPAFSDTTAYIVGSIFKGPKLAPDISPKKTISGAIGGVVGGIAAGAVVLLLSELELSTLLPVGKISPELWLNILHYMIIGAVGAAFVIVGDLIASYIKRQCGVKDFGKLLPGHGGVMDRVDSMVLSAGFLYAYFMIPTLFG